MYDWAGRDDRWAPRSCAPVVALGSPPWVLYYTADLSVNLYRSMKVNTAVAALTVSRWPPVRSRAVTAAPSEGNGGHAQAPQAKKQMRFSYNGKNLWYSQVKICPPFFWKSARSNGTPWILFSFFQTAREIFGLKRFCGMLLKKYFA
jgi:hypothetical protein